MTAISVLQQFSFDYFKDQPTEQLSPKHRSKKLRIAKEVQTGYMWHKYTQWTKETVNLGYTYQTLMIYTFIVATND